MKRAISYSRFSSKRQAKGDSQERQDSGYIAFCLKYKYQQERDLVFRGRGQSAYRGLSRVLQSLLYAIDQGKIRAGDIVVFDKFDRVTRNDIDNGWQFIRKILVAGVDIGICFPERVYTLRDLRDLAVSIEIKVALWASHQFSERLSNNLSEMWKRRREKGWQGGIVKSWIKYVDGKPTLIEEKAKAIRLMAQWCIAGLGARLIVKKLESQGITNIAEGSCGGRKTATKRWRAAYVRAILTDPAIYGTVQRYRCEFDEDDGRRRNVPDGEPISDFYPAVISESDFYKCQAALKARYRKPGKSAVMLSKVSIGDKITLKIKRMEQEQEIKFVAE